MVVGGFMQWAILMPGSHAVRLWKFLPSSRQDSGLQVVEILQSPPCIRCTLSPHPTPVQIRKQAQSSRGICRTCSCLLSPELFQPKSSFHRSLSPSALLSVCMRMRVSVCSRRTKKPEIGGGCLLLSRSLLVSETRSLADLGTHCF